VFLELSLPLVQVSDSKLPASCSGEPQANPAEPPPQMIILISVFSNGIRSKTSKDFNQKLGFNHHFSNSLVWGVENINNSSTNS
jgi:hypothetical protein